MITYILWLLKLILYKFSIILYDNNQYIFGLTNSSNNVFFKRPDDGDLVGSFKIHLFHSATYFDKYYILFINLFTISKGIKQYFPNKRLNRSTFNVKLIDKRKKT